MRRPLSHHLELVLVSKRLLMNIVLRVVPCLIVVGVLCPPPAFAQGGPALVKLTPIVEREVGEGQTFVGTVIPVRMATVGSAVDGRVVEFPVNEGDRVEAGQKLAQLLTETITLEHRAAEAELDFRAQELKELENGSLPDEIEQSRAMMESAKAAAEYRQSQRERIATLFDRGGAASQQQLDEVNSQALATTQAYQEAAAKHRLMVDGPRPERIAQAKAQVAMQQAVVKKLEDQIKKHTMISRFAGYVTREHTEEGQWVSRGDPVAEVAALDEVYVEAKVVESQVPYIKLGSTVRVDVPALPDRTFTGTVAIVVPQADVRSRTFPVKVRVSNVIDDAGQPLLKSGMLARVLLPTGSKQQAILVPKDSLVLGGPSPMIWVVDTSKAKSQPATDSGPAMRNAPAKAVPVRLGIADGSLIQVTGDVDAKSSVVILGNERIRPGKPGEPTMVRWVSQTRSPKGEHGASAP